MSHQDNLHPEVFAPPDPQIEKGTRTVYPPTPDAHGIYDFCEVWNWFILMDQTYEAFVRVGALLRSEIISMPPGSAERVQECLNDIELLRPLFLCRDLSLVPEQQRCKDACGMLYNEAAVWAEQNGCLKIMAQFITGSADKWQSLSQALVENKLNGQKDWRDAKSPVKWVKARTNQIASKEARLQKFALNYSREPKTIGLEEIAESPMEVLLVRKYTHHSIEQLRTAAAEEPELAVYIRCKVRFPSWTSEAIWHHLGWDELRGKRIDRRYRRLRRRLRELGHGIQCREYRPRPGLSDASSTVYFEELFDGERGSGMGVWQHRSAHA